MRDAPRVTRTNDGEENAAGTAENSTPRREGEVGDKEKDTSPDMSSSLSKFFAVLDPLRDLLADALDGGAHKPAQ